MFTSLLILFSSILLPAQTVLVSGEDVFGQCLDTNQAALVTAPAAEYGQLPLTVECRVQLTDAKGYNILVAHESKASAAHWELFTTPGDGKLHAYTPGRDPDHIHSDTVLTDGKWHWIGFVLDRDEAALFVDAVEVVRIASHIHKETRVPGNLVIGGLVEGGLHCRGYIDLLRISSGATWDHPLPTAPLTANPAVLGLWNFNEDDPARDDSGHDRNGEFRFREPKEDETPTLDIPGGMPTALQPLPESEDVTPLREIFAKHVQSLDLRSIDIDTLEDYVLRQWSHDFRWIGKKEYPESRPGGPDPATLRRQVFDENALVWESDDKVLSTVWRRVDALVAATADDNDTEYRASLRHDMERLRRACSKEKLDPDSPSYKALYLALCALRRQWMLSDPALDFDSLLCVVRGTFEGSVRSNPQTQDAQGGHFVTQYFGFNALPGGGLYRINSFKTRPEIVDILKDARVQKGRLKGQILDYGAFATPDLSYDGSSILFAWTENEDHRWIHTQERCFHLFKVNTDGSGLMQLTDGAYNDFDPCWLPDGRIAFVSERRGGYIRCFDAYLKVPSFTLFSMDEDGGDIQPLSYFETSEWNPSVNNEGQLVYTRWDYVDRENCLGTRFWISNPDGTNPRAPHGNYPLPFHTFPDHVPWSSEPGRGRDSRFGAPLVEMGIRAVPNSPLYIFTAAPHHGSVYGSLCMLDLRGKDDHHMSQIRRITPEEPFPETEMPGRRHYRYGTPWPLNESLYLCNEWENIVLLDRFGNKEILCDLRAMPCAHDERLRIINPIPLRPRTTPPALPKNVRSREKPDAPPATIAVMDVYNSDLPFPEGTRIKWLRIVQNIPKSNHAMGEPMIGYERENTPRIPLGIVPVEEDGSAYFEAPVAKQLIFQALDENFMAVQSMRSSAFVHPGEQMTCMGCHEDPYDAPQRIGHPLALQRPPSPLQPECGPLEPISYYRQIKPIFEESCLPCHREQQAGLQDMSYENLKEEYSFWFAGAMFGDMTTDYSGVHGGSRTIPGRFGARASKIGKALFDEHHKDSVSDKDRRQIIQWLDCNSLRLGAYVQEEEQLKGELVWPVLDVDPENVSGVETATPGLSGNFWHDHKDLPLVSLTAAKE
ncbi:MAG: hypothetical protein GX117_13310 [Candidatus Hydrogenedentes bacterium]|nr:hypothetical protein [Candidatus Hydrogenedentota bacterium]